MRNASWIEVAGVLVTSAMVLGGCVTTETPPGSQRAPLTIEGAADFDAMQLAALSSPTTVVEAPWGEEEGAYGREYVAAQTGPTAIAAERGEGFSVVDMIGSRIYGYDDRGVLQRVVESGASVVDDLVVMPDGGVALLAYHRLPAPGYEVILFDARGTLSSRRPGPQEAAMPTALVADGDDLYVEQRHEWLHPVGGGARIWGRPAGDLLVRARLEEGEPVLWTTDRAGQMTWSLRINTPWPVTELIALESSEPYLALVMRHIETDESGEPIGHQTWAVLLSTSGEALGKIQLVDSRVTFAKHPFALTPSGDLLELVTTEEGVTVLRYENEGGAS